jgi:predicted lipoprotein
MTKDTTRRHLARIIIVSVFILALAALALTGQLATVRPIGSIATNSTLNPAGQAFNKVSYVDGIWATRVVPAVAKGAIDAGVLIPALQKDAAAATNEFGHDVGGAGNFLVRLSGRVARVDTSSMNGLITIAVPIEGHPVSLEVQVGPVISGTALRDAVGFITFSLFTNQMQFGDVGDELNNRVLKEVLAGIEPRILIGKRVSVEGAFTYDSANPRSLIVTPAIFTVEK